MYETVLSYRRKSGNQSVISPETFSRYVPCSVTCSWWPGRDTQSSVMVAFAVVTCNNIPIILGHLKQWQFCVKVPTDDSYYWNRSVVNDSFGSARSGEWPRLPTFQNKDCVPQLRHYDVRKRLGSCQMNVYSWWNLTSFLVKNYSCKFTIILWTLNSMFSDCKFSYRLWYPGNVSS